MGVIHETRPSDFACTYLYKSGVFELSVALSEQGLHCERDSAPPGRLRKEGLEVTSNRINEM